MAVNAGPFKHEGPLEFNLDGIEEDVEIIIDDWGIPHIYAQSQEDVFFAQGFQAARDRLFQIDLWRRRGLGKLAEVLGAKHVEQDCATRLFLFRGDIRAEWLSYSTEAKDVVTSFVNGVNAYVAWALESPEDRLSPEFIELGYEPALWEPEDVVRIRTHGLLYNAEQELARALTLRDANGKVEDLRSVREPASIYDDFDPSLYAHLNEQVLDVYRLAFAPVDFTANLDQGAADPLAPSGSNNWVVSPERSATGRPIVANDPHRAVTLPSLRYLAHLEAPNISVIGAGEPNLPGISIGHNQDVAYALTIWAVDHEDLYVYELHPDRDDLYLYQGQWEKFTQVEETSAVKGSEDVVHELTFSRHGPVVAVDSENRRAVAVRAVWLEPGMAPYLGSLEFQEVKNSAEFRKALRRWGAPGVNMIYADTHGETGWQASALVPRRPGWDGSLPVPGDGRYEWDGFAYLEELPSIINPDSGWFSSSNENNLPEDFDNNALTTTRDWYTSGRHERIAQWFDGGAEVSIESSWEMQSNADNLHARVLLDLLSQVNKEVGENALWSELQDWNGHEAADSRAALLYQVWEKRHLRPWMVETQLPRYGVSENDLEKVKKLLLRDDTLFSDTRPDIRMIKEFNLEVESERELVAQGVIETLDQAKLEIEKLLNVKFENSTWGDLHQTTLRHAVLAGVKNAPEEWGQLPSVPRSGSGETVGLTGYDPTFNAVMGSSFRVVMDVGQWDSSRVINSPGQSGDPRSEHYADLYQLWANNESVPLLYSRDAVENSKNYTVKLIPKGR